MRWAWVDGVMGGAGQGTRGLATVSNLDARHRWQGAWKKLVLNFPGDGNLILETAALVFFFDQRTDGVGHLVERFAELAQLVALLHLYPVGKISRFNKLGGLIQICNSIRYAAGPDNTQNNRHHSYQNKNGAQPDRHQPVTVAQFAK